MLLQARDEIDEILAAIASLERDESNDFMLYLEIGKIKTRVSQAANELLPNDPDFSFEPDEEDKINTYPICDSCGYYTESPYLVCAVHPTGPAEANCPDYEDALGEAVQFPLDTPYENPWHPDPDENWSPPGTRYVGGELEFVES